MNRNAHLVVVAIVCAVVTACGLQSSSGRFIHASWAGDDRPLFGAKITVTSKSFTEGVLLGKITATILNAAGADVLDLTNAPGSNSSRQAMIDGQADVTWEYTGTAWASYLKRTEVVTDPRVLWTRVRDAERENGLEWLPAAPFNNTYAFAVTAESQSTLGLRNLSDLLRLPANRRPMCVDPEFQSRADGLGSLLSTYGVPIGNGTPAGAIQTMDAGVIYSAVSARTCLAGDVYATDGRIRKLGLRLLEDDLRALPPYSGAPVVRSDVLAKYPPIAAVLARVANLLTDEVMQELNGEIDVEGKDPAAVAADWLRKARLVI